MPVNSYIIDASSGRSVKVLPGGALATTGVMPSVSFNAELAVDDVVVNIVPAKADHSFCVTGALLTGDKSIDQNVDASVVLYVGDSETTAAVDAISSLFIVPVARSSSRDILSILLDTPEGKWINGVTTDDNVFITILGYYIKMVK